MILRSIISSNKANKTIVQLIMTMLNQSVNCIGATKLKQTSPEQTRLIIQNIAVERANEKIKHLLPPEDFIGWRRSWLNDSNAVILVLLQWILRRVVEGPR
jgi:hypothetical protein